VKNLFKELQVYINAENSSTHRFWQLNFVTLSIEFIHFDIEFVSLAIEFVPLAIEFVALGEKSS